MRVVKEERSFIPWLKSSGFLAEACKGGRPGRSIRLRAIQWVVRIVAFLLISGAGVRCVRGAIMVALKGCD